MDKKSFQFRLYKLCELFVNEITLKSLTALKCHHNFHQFASCNFVSSFFFFFSQNSSIQLALFVLTL